jgi:SAM-dependent methyltransferase
VDLPLLKSISRVGKSLGPIWRPIRKTLRRYFPKGGLRPGDAHYRAYVGPPGRYELMGELQLDIMIHVGLRPDSVLLDVGCGSLRGGKKLVPYLEPGHYFGIEPNEWLIEAGIANELGRDVAQEKNPRFSNDSNFTLTIFGVSFDFILAQSIFTHAAPHQIERCLAQAKLAMKQDAVFVANFLQGDSDYQGDEWVYPDCCSYTFGFFESLARKHGLRCAPLELPESWPGGLAFVQFTHDRA